MSFLDSCSDQMNVPTLNESLHQSVIWFNDFVTNAKNRVEEVWGQLKLEKSRTKFIAFLDELAASHTHMTEMILDDPISFFDPKLYIRKAQDWIAAPRWYLSDTYFFSPNNLAINLSESFGQGDWFVPGFVRVDDDEHMYASLLMSKFSTAGTSILSPEYAYQFGIDNYIGNVLWARGFPDPQNERYAFLALQSMFPNKEFIFLRL